MTPNGKFQPETNVPAIIALQFAEGKPVNSNFRDQATGLPKREYQFTLVDGRKWYASEHVAEKMRREGIAARQPIQVVRQENGAVEVTPLLSVAPVAQTVQNLYRAPSEPAPFAPVQTYDAQPEPAAKRMMSAMAAAVDAIIETQAYAQRRGLGVTFSEESVRAIGLSIFISNEKAVMGR